MKVVVISHPVNGLIAVVENPEGCMSKEAVAVAWSRSEGYEKVPNDLKATELNLISYGSVQRKLTPCHELDELEEAGKKV